MSSFVFLVHHADALSPGVDPMQPLSFAGRAGVERLAAEAAGRGVKPVCIWHSGKLRARQTGQAFWQACNPFSTITAERGLLPGDPPEWIRDRLAGETRDIMVVSHMPYLPALLALMTGREHADFPSHGIVALEAEGDGWIEKWRLD